MLGRRDELRAVEPVLRVHVRAVGESHPQDVQVALRPGVQVGGVWISSFAFTSAPASISARAASTWLPLVASTSGVLPPSPRSSMAAPAARAARTASASPDRAAACRLAGAAGSTVGGATGVTVGVAADRGRRRRRQSCACAARQQDAGCQKEGQRLEISNLRYAATVGGRSWTSPHGTPAYRTPLCHERFRERGDRVGRAPRRREDRGCVPGRRGSGETEAAVRQARRRPTVPSPTLTEKAPGTRVWEVFPML